MTYRQYAYQQRATVSGVTIKRTFGNATSTDRARVFVSDNERLCVRAEGHGQHGEVRRLRVSEPHGAGGR